MTSNVVFTFYYTEAFVSHRGNETVTVSIGCSDVGLTPLCECLTRPDTSGGAQGDKHTRIKHMYDV